MGCPWDATLIKGDINMTVADLIKELSHFDPNLEVGVKWLHSVSSLQVVGVAKLGKNFRQTKRPGIYEYVLLSPFDVDLRRDY